MIVESGFDPGVQFPLISGLLSDLSGCNSIGEIAALLCDQGRKAVAADGVAFVLFEEGHANYIEESSVDIFLKGMRPPLDDCICGWCQRMNQTALVNDIHHDDRINPADFENSFVKSLAMIPIRSEDRPIGSVGFYFSEAGDFPDQRTPVMECLAAAATFAMRNVTLLSGVDQVVAERTDALERVNTELESFAYTVSHDLKNPLSVVKTNCWTVQNLMAAECSEKVMECVRRIDGAAERMKAMIDGMLQMYRLTNEELDLRDTDLSIMANEVAEELQNLDRKRRISFEIEEEMHAYGDARMLRALLENLFSNAWKFTDTVKSARIEFFSTENSEEGTVFAVRDNGCGFSEEEAQTLFRVFHRLPGTREIEGHGVGLSSVRRIINKHGGRVWAKGAKGKGATFFFTLPLLPIDTKLEEFIGEQVDT